MRRRDDEDSDEGRLGYMHWEEHWRKNGHPDLHFGDGLACMDGDGASLWVDWGLDD